MPHSPMGDPVPAVRRISPSVLAYIARCFLTPYWGCLLGFMGLFMLVDSINGDVRDFIEQNGKLRSANQRLVKMNAPASEKIGDAEPSQAAMKPGVGRSHELIPWSVICRFMLFKQPQNLTYVIPFACLLAASFMTMILGKNSELTAMRAAGMSLVTCCIPIWVIVAISSMVVLTINESWGPECLKKSDAIARTYLKKNKRTQNRIAFAYQKEHRDWLVDNLDIHDASTGITVRQYRPDGSFDYLLAAQSGEYLQGKWQFHHGFIKRYDESGRPRQAAPECFEVMSMPYSESPENLNTHSMDRNRMTISELWAVLRNRLISSPRERRLLQALLLHRLFSPLGALIAALFGVAFTLPQGRKSMMAGFVYAVVALLLFYVVSELGILCVQNGWLKALGWLGPWLGGAVPSLGFLAVAGYVMSRRA